MPNDLALPIWMGLNRIEAALRVKAHHLGVDPEKTHDAYRIHVRGNLRRCLRRARGVVRSASIR